MPNVDHLHGALNILVDVVAVGMKVRVRVSSKLRVRIRIRDRVSPQSPCFIKASN